MLEVKLTDGKEGCSLHTERPYGDDFDRVENGSVMLITPTAYHAHGVFQSATIITPTTTVIALPEGTGSIILTDVVIAAKKVNNTTLTLQFNDGVNSAVIMSPDTINEPANFSWTVAGRIQGWSGAWVEVVTGDVGTPSVTVTIGFMKTESGLLYPEWDSYR